MKMPSGTSFRVAAFGVLLLATADPVSSDEPFVAAFDRFYSDTSLSDPTHADAQSGRLLLTELNCTACHAGIRELAAAPAPQLTDAPLRIQEDWIRQFLRSPKALKPGTLMPDVLHEIPEEQREHHIDALLAFLSYAAPAQATEPVLVANALVPILDEFWRKGDADRGQALYHQTGCVACHAVDTQFQPTGSAMSDLEQQIQRLQLTPEELEEYGLVLPQPVRPVPQSDLSLKYSQRSLSMFLIEPTLVHPSGRMPSLKLAPMEAADIAAYLFRSRSETRPIAEIRTFEKRSAELVADGRRLFGELGCANCHSHPQVQPAMARPLASLQSETHTEYCAGKGRGTPSYPLSSVQKAAIQRALRELTAVAPTDRSSELTNIVDLTLLQLNCFACHHRSGRGGPGADQWQFFQNIQQVDIGDEGRIPPTLDAVGWKMKTPWLQKVLEGQARVRPHFQVRMPTFPQHAQSLAIGLHEVDRPSREIETLSGSLSTELPAEIRATAATPDDLESGRHLFNLGCVQCHSLRGEALPGVVGVDVAEPAKRFQPAWFRAFLLNPGVFKKNTRMPTFFPQGRSADPAILDGDVERQIAAIWNYLNAAQHPLPDKLQQARQQDFELIPQESTIVLRTFMDQKSAGTHAIAVGFPEKVHFAFDANSVRLAEIWKGRFLNSYGTWFDRFAPAAVPLGDRNTLLPARAWYSADSASDERFIADHQHPVFQGYRVDSNGTPTFLYQFDGVQIEDRIMPIDSVSLKRTLTFNAATEQSSSVLWLAVLNDIPADDVDDPDVNGVSSDSPGAATYSTRSGLQATVTGAAKSKLVPQNRSTEWLIAVRMRQGRAQLEVIYRW